MSSSDWLKDYDSDLYNIVTAMMGVEDPTYYNRDAVERLQSLGMTGFYFNAVDAGTSHAPDWLPQGHRLATMIITGRVIRSAANITSPIYEAALNATPNGGKMHSILYYKDVVVDVQSLVSLGNLNKHRAMGAQVIVGSPTTGFLKAVTTFVSRFAGRDDIIQLDSGTWDDGLGEIQKLLQAQQYGV